ncbi:MAG: helix-turn-helix domain-containing protein [Oscillospiraceae bacterium]|nr:helix-turn-helix domain-containing protein [Oscillospiraceae bacterium]
MNDIKSPHYWAVIPAPVRYDTTIPANAKLLYAELSSLANREGFCFASNAYFAENFSLTDTSIRRLLKALSDQGYIRVNVIRDDKTHAVLSREIYVGINPIGRPQASAQNCVEASRQKSAEGSAQKCLRFNRKNNIKSFNNIPPITPQGGKRLPESAKWKPERFEAFWAYYRQNINPANRAAARKAWDKLKPDDDMIHDIGMALKARLRTDEEWKRGIGKPHASTYLNGQQWLDTGPTAPAASQQGEEPTGEEGWGWQ